MKVVEILCPKSLDLTDLIKEKDQNTKSILQTIDIYDSVIIKQEVKKQTGVVITSKNEITDELKSQLKKMIIFFSQYTGIGIENLIIDIVKDDIDFLEQNEVVLAGLLIGLNEYFKTNLSLEELIILGKRVDNLIPYYVTCGYKKIDNNYLVSKLGENIYTKYHLIEPIQGISQEQLLRMRKFIKNYSNIDYGEINQHFYFIALKDNISLSIPISIKKEFPKTKIYTCKNTYSHKILIKYL